MNIFLNLVIIVSVIGGIALIFGVLLVLASKIFQVNTDPRIDEITALLPGANCSACGFTGCSSYAAAVVKNGEKTNLCRMVEAENIEKIGKILGIESEKPLRMRAVVMCSGASSLTARKYKYQGIKDCLFASKIGGGEKECAFGCLGLGTCVKCCPFNAIRIEDSVAVVEYEKCRGCGKCADSCPKGLIRLIPYDAKHWVGCKSHDKGSAVRSCCDAGCLGCTMCIRNCPTGAISINNNVAEINYDLCINCGKCADICPRHIIWSNETHLKGNDSLGTKAIKEMSDKND